MLPSDRAALHRRIEARFDAMLRAGLVDELRALRKRYALRPGLASMRCVGYRQAWEYLEGRITKAESRDRGIYATRQLAKRQPTWLRAMEVLLVVDCLAKDASPQMHEIAARQLGTTKNAEESHE